ncbi:hypothetical protein ABB37_07839 [Leptomonas pyrrhocoris]|uniref:Uncharacterized protein n=1 Tax=Leptomonas pyrrhocoris TaxID=157538 RepID=A0A0M9FV19_LEPPY|nr:hypothetical protein ABB37_07839 [Leptomonas pyrrhocoris]KPA76549.1 hypothetical protein ABB37_07839 [Leptomonas pyrrhocoris]|eukprot:XP_015654988.1 hypothetical protein ABB37_07839 [Leptomonas pyrrhocoris]
MVLDQPEVQPLLQSGTASLEQASRVVGTQLRHYQQINRRMRQALEMLHGQFQALRRQRDQEVAERTVEARKMRALEGECQRLRAHLTRAASPEKLRPSHPSRSPSVASSAHSHGHRHGAPHRAYAGTPPLSSSSPSALVHAAGGVPRGSHGHAMEGATATNTSGLAAAAAAPPPAPLGWSASSNIAKRQHVDPSDSMVLSSRGGGDRDRRAADAAPTLQPSSFDRNTSSTTSNSYNIMFTPRSQAIASLHPPLSSRGAGGRLPEDSTVPPLNDFRLNTPLAAALQQRHTLSSPSPASATPVLMKPSSRPLQKLFALRGAAP